jgi:hypothetical protein
VILEQHRDMAGTLVVDRTEPAEQKATQRADSSRNCRYVQVRSWCITKTLSAVSGCSARVSICARSVKSAWGN